MDDDLEDSANNQEIEENLSIQSQQQIAQDTREPEDRQLSSGEKHSLSDLSEVRDGNAHRPMTTKAEEIIKQDGAVSTSIGKPQHQRSRITDGQEPANDDPTIRHPARASKAQESNDNYSPHDDGFGIAENISNSHRPAGTVHERGPGP